MKDYGDLWEEAWNNHVTNFKHEEEENYVSAREYNRRHGNSVLRTQSEQISAPYPPNLEIRCLEEILEASSSSKRRLPPERALKLWAALWNDGIACKIVGRAVDDDGQVFYTIESEVHSQDETTDEIHQERRQVLREAVKFFDVPYTTDLFFEGAFRHPIGLPDDIMPEAWRGFSGAD